MCLQPQISQPKLGQIVHIGGVLKTSGPADFKSVPGFEIFFVLYLRICLFSF